MLLLGLTFMQIGMTSRHNAYAHKGDSEAFALAEAGVNHAIWLMSGFSEGRAAHNEVQGALAGGTPQSPATYQSTAYQLNRGRYFFDITCPQGGLQNVALIQAGGISRTGEQERLRVVARYLSEEAVLAIFGHALFVDHNVSLGGNLYVDAQPGQGGAGVHANGDIDVWGNPQIIGDVSATGTITNGESIDLVSGTLNQGAGQIPMPGIDVAWYREHADQLYSGPVSLSANICEGGTSADSVVIFVDGDLTINGSITGVGTIVVTGDVTITGNVQYSSGSSRMALIALASVKISGSCHIDGLVYAHNVDNTATVLSNGTTDIHGAMVSDTLWGVGNLSITYDPSLQNLRPMPGLEGVTQVGILSWQRF